MSNTAARLGHLKRMRWGVLAGVVAFIAISVVMNVLHAPNTFWGRAIAAVPPLALFVSLEFISRIPSSSRWLSIGRIVATLIVSIVSGAISYTHMVGTVHTYGGESGWRAAIWPLSVDGLMFVATLSLVEVVRKIRQLEDALPEPEPIAPAVEPVAVPDFVPAMERLPIAPASAIPFIEDPAHLAFREAMRNRGRRSSTIRPVA